MRPLLGIGEAVELHGPVLNRVGVDEQARLGARAASARWAAAVTVTA